MRRSAAAAGSAAWFIVAPGVVAGLVPWWLAGGNADGPLPLAGLALIAAGAAVLVHAFARFVLDGLGTPAPAAPPEHLVVRGLYRHVRNPMYVAVVTVIVGQALVLDLALLLYAAVAATVMVTFVRIWEEPDLRRRFGASYDEYCRAVPGWWPRLRPWQP